jgi:hypothetical protein
VERKITNPKARLHRARLSDGTALRVTSEHPFFDAASEHYVPFVKLAPNHALFGFDFEQDTAVAHRSSQIFNSNDGAVPLAGPELAYDLTVSRHHNYFVHGFLVHNKSLPIEQPLPPTPTCPGGLMPFDANAGVVLERTSERAVVSATPTTYGALSSELQSLYSAVPEQAREDAAAAPPLTRSLQALDGGVAPDLDASKVIAASGIVDASHGNDASVFDAQSRDASRLLDTVRDGSGEIASDSTLLALDIRGEWCTLLEAKFPYALEVSLAGGPGHIALRTSDGATTLSAESLTAETVGETHVLWFAVPPNQAPWILQAASDADFTLQITPLY